MSTVVVETDEDDILVLRYNAPPPHLRHQSDKEEHTGYLNNTYIDWSTESHKQNSPKTTATIWIVLIVLSFAIGYITLFADLVLVWLHDFKKGICVLKALRHEDANELDHPSRHWSIFHPYLTCEDTNWKTWSQFFFNSNIAPMNFFLYVIGALSMALLGLIFVKKAKVPIRESGIPEIKLIISGFKYNEDYLSLHTFAMKSLSLILVVSSGLWLGKEGPLIHISSCIVLASYYIFVKDTNEATLRELISAATAMGIAVAFNAPIGGVLFIIELIPTYFSPVKVMWKTFISSTISVLILIQFKIFTGNFFEEDLFDVKFGNVSWLFMEIIPFIILGILGGFYGYAFVFLNRYFKGKRKTLYAYLRTRFPAIDPSIMEIVLVIIITTIVAYPIQLSKVTLDSLFNMMATSCTEDSPLFICHQKLLAPKVLYISITGFLLSSYTFGIDLPGGVLMPSLVIGACSGRLIGIASQSIQSRLINETTCTAKSCLISPSSYAVIGGAAFLTGITKLTISVVVIMFELTGAVSYVLPIMLAVMTLKFVNDWLTNENIYNATLKYDFNNGEQVSQNQVNEGKGSGLVQFDNAVTMLRNKLPDLPILQVMIPTELTKCIHLVGDWKTCQQWIEFIHDDNHEGYPVIFSKDKPISLGYVNKVELLLALNDTSGSIVQFQLKNSLKVKKEIIIPTPSITIPISVQKSELSLSDQCPMITVIEIFEKMNINYLIFNDSQGWMIGFIDRFILANLIETEFSSLHYSIHSTDFDIEEVEEESERVKHLLRPKANLQLIT
ncbi:uncharacterized protein KQ657_004163 [Scheffersomyces spartinae]|uniref:Chloride channel protein n=1 Tax=Scheffersomyces spartinae TaxID=45513 RepID=A0A9P7VBR5_9ASCO|nr:uncharacterized protein KQ657_004163 [Scheffersomyces spartinae]KAG7195049.1 hypothetical protein KQ657_004163 [Scheffersomyces spartinae]